MDDRNCREMGRFLKACKRFKGACRPAGSGLSAASFGGKAELTGRTTRQLQGKKLLACSNESTCCDIAKVEKNEALIGPRMVKGA